MTPKQIRPTRTADLASLATTTCSSSLSPALEQVVASAQEYIREAASDRTRTAYLSQWKTFCAFCAEHRLEPLPAAPDTVALYVTARADEKRKISTIRQAVAAIAKAHEKAGHDSPCRNVKLREILKGITRKHGSAPRQKRPLLNTLLQRIVTEIPTSLSGSRDRALLLVGFAGAFRRSELVSLEVEDVEIDEQGLRILLRRSKTDAEGKGREIAIPFGKMADTCPVRSLQTWLQQAGITAGFLFRSVDRHGNVGGGLSGKDVARIVKRWTAQTGLDPSAFSGHSLRSGLATSAAKAGRSLDSIMRTTGHTTVGMVQKYIRSANLFEDNASDGLL